LKLAGIVVAIAGISVLGVALLIGSFWREIGAAEISLAGWLAMGFGIVVTLALGIGLMALVFISSRRGYDDPGRDER
jgi:hypothetical protein